ncbi:hypothetical protein ACFOKF_25420 [Sphingobium rhizovicinum]|uniref:SDH C-terminal domain-containing protein n=1 Tax=Sphingobium rhizovicinum TaxID=432308 RepID=A0ABV7NM78_9SPHN
MLREAKAAGCVTLDGSGMTVHQAAGAFEHFTGRKADAARCRQFPRGADRRHPPMTFGIATVSLSGTLEEKLRAAAAGGFDGVEIFENDLIASHCPRARCGR